MPAATKTFVLRALASFAAVLLVNVLFAGTQLGGPWALVVGGLRYGLVGAGVFFLVVAASAWGVALGNRERS